MKDHVKPEWFNCLRCLWCSTAWREIEGLKENEYAWWCSEHNEAFVLGKGATYFCSRWTCARCWGGWKMLETHAGSYAKRVDHNLCTPVTFQEEENP
jgi:hypothetical protein